MPDEDTRTRLSQWIHCERWWLREFLAELIGTAFLVALGDGAVAQVVLSKQANGTFLTINLAFALAIAFGVYISGGVSGGHINPAITLAMCLLGKTKWKQLPIYMAGQYLGSFIGALCVFAIYSDAINTFDGGVRQVTGPNATAGIFATYPVEFVSTGSCFFDQMIGTTILSLCVLAITDPRNMDVPKSAVPILVGFVVGLVGMAYGMNCGFAINPARDFGPRLFTAVAGWGIEVFSFRQFNWFWVPVVAPHIGAIAGAFLYEFSIGLHWPYIVDTQNSIGQNNRCYQSETDFNLASLSAQKTNPLNNNPQPGFNGGMRVYVS